MSHHTGKGKKAYAYAYGSRRGSALDLEDVPDDDEASAESTASTAKSGRRVTWADEEEDAPVDAFQDGLDKLFEKRRVGTGVGAAGTTTPCTACLLTCLTQSVTLFHPDGC